MCHRNHFSSNQPDLLFCSRTFYVARSFNVCGISFPLFEFERFRGENDGHFSGQRPGSRPDDFDALSERPFHDSSPDRIDLKLFR